MKIVISDEISEYSAEIQDGCTIDEVVAELKGLLVCAGFNPKNVDEHLNTGDWGLADDEFTPLDPVLQEKYSLTSEGKPIDE